MNPRIYMKASQTTCALFIFSIALLLGGCGKNSVDDALTSDANGYLCPSCQCKFYTEREVFPTRCPQCGKPKVEMVVSFVCADDKHVTFASQKRGSVACEQCKKTISSVTIPHEADLKAWGATKKSREEVGG